LRTIVINAAAYNQVDVAEKEPQAAFLVNALASSCAGLTRIHLIKESWKDGLPGQAGA